MKLFILVYVILINICGFFSIYLDKKYAIKKRRRISERDLLTIAFLGGALGSLVSMHINHHKTSKVKFKIGIPFALVLNLFVISMCLKVLTNV